MRTLERTTNGKFYIYRNLIKGCFSVKHGGKVIAHCDTFTAYKCTAKVNQATRARVVHLKKKFVHAYIVADRVDVDAQVMMVECGCELTYNPYTQEQFELANYHTNEMKSVEGWLLRTVTGFRGKVYASPYDRKHPIRYPKNLN